MFTKLLLRNKNRNSKIIKYCTMGRLTKTEGVYKKMQPRYQVSLEEYLPGFLAEIPEDWLGTTYANSNLLGREGFAESLLKLLELKQCTKESKEERDTRISTKELLSLGNAEDYFRVSSNLSCVLELALALDAGLTISQVFTYASRKMGIISVLLLSKLPVVLYLTETCESPFTPEQINTLELLGCSLTIKRIENIDLGDFRPEIVTLLLKQGDRVYSSEFQHAYDGVVSQESGTLYIYNTEKIDPQEVLVIRKRLSTPRTTSMCFDTLQSYSGNKLNVEPEVERTPTPKPNVNASALHEFFTHLQELSGSSSSKSAYPAVFTAGLPAICSLWVALLADGGADVLMASTAYGGSSQMTELIAKHVNRDDLFTKSTFDITGDNDINQAIQHALSRLATSGKCRTTVVFVEVPTNPDMKVPEITSLAEQLLTYQKDTGKKILLLFDTTFAPGSRVLDKINKSAPELCSMVFMSMSKSISRGKTTAGCIIANSDCKESCKVLKNVHNVAEMFDTKATHDQMKILVENHIGVEERCAMAYKFAASTGNVLLDAVEKFCQGYKMDLHFVSPENVALGFTSSTFSFNLPPLRNEAGELLKEKNEELAQKFVDILTSHPSFKPCVSFGQDNSLIYCTVPATSTQGVIKNEEKAKQAVNGVQLARLSFPVSVDDDSEVHQHIYNTIKELYT